MVHARARDRRPGVTARRAFGQIRKLPSGRFQARYVGPDGGRHTAPSTFIIKGHADTWLAEESLLVSRGTWVAPSMRNVVRSGADVTFGDYAAQWLAGRDLSPRTRQHYARMISLHMTDLAPLPLADLTRVAVASWYRTTLVGKPTYRQQAYILARSIAGSAVDDGLIDENPVNVKGAGKRIKNRRTLRLLESYEIEMLGKAMPERMHALVVLGAWTGLRYGEITELRRADVRLIDVDKGVAFLNVERGVVRLDREDGPDYAQPAERDVHEVKSEAGVRVVPVPPHVVPVLVEHLREHVGTAPNALLFSSVKDPTAHLAESTMHRHWARARASIGRDDLRFHDLRHNAGTRAAQTGASLREVMAFLGHSSTDAAMRYQHAADERLSSMAQRMSEAAR